VLVGNVAEVGIREKEPAQDFADAKEYQEAKSNEAEAQRELARQPISPRSKNRKLRPKTLGIRAYFDRS
jgi:hypothetical protein